jgi:hypothetical protein
MLVCDGTKSTPAAFKKNFPESTETCLAAECIRSLSLIIHLKHLILSFAGLLMSVFLQLHTKSFFTVAGQK